jgi:hypothetical protein
MNSHATHPPRGFAIPPASAFTRRDFLERTGMGFGMTSLLGLTAMGLLRDESHAAAANTYSPLAPKPPHFPVKAKRILHIFAQGAPSHIDTFDPKPGLAEFDGKSLPDDARGTGFASPFKFEKKGKSGLEISEVFPRLGEHADKLAVVRSMMTDIPAHDQATVFMNTGSLRFVRPSVGSWVVYGLGSENMSLPGYIALSPNNVDAQNLRSAFLPGVFQGTPVNTRELRVERLIENIQNNFTSIPEQRRQLDLLHQLNELNSQKLRKDGQLEARLQSYELAFQMQMEAQDAFDIGKEPQSVRDAYGVNTTFGRQLLIARRLLQKGVRFVQVWHGGWDHHSNIATALRQKAGECDGAIAAMLTEMASNGMLNDTLIVWGGEFGRTPAADGNAQGNPGRNHNHRAFSVWLAGAGVKGGTVVGKTDDLGGRAVEDKVHIHDLHATLLHLLGFDHEKLTFRYNGRDFRLTDVHGNVVKKLVA